MRRDYTANGGWETFLAYEDPRQDILVGLLRLRKVAGPAKERQPQLQGRCSIVRELHVYGTAVAVHARDSSKHQHQVLSKSLSLTISLPHCKNACVQVSCRAFFCIQHISKRFTSGMCFTVREVTQKVLTALDALQESK